MADYYYLISSLPSLSTNATLPFDPQTLFLKINGNLTPEDQELFRWLILPHDIQNVVGYFDQQANASIRYQHQLPAIYTTEEIAAMAAQPTQFPEFIYQVVATISEKKHDSKVLEELLWKAFYEAVLSINDTFLIKYFSLFRQVKTIAWFINQKQNSDLLGTSELPDDFLFHELDRTQGQILSSGDYASLGDLSKLLGQGAFVSAEDLQLKYVLEWLESATNMDYFNRNAVFSYFLKYQWRYRQQQFDTEKGNKRLAQLRSKFKQQFQTLTT